MRHQWLTPTILGCVATLAIAVSGCGEGTAEIVQGDPTIVENIGTQQHGDVEYIESTDALGCAVSTRRACPMRCAINDALLQQSWPSTLVSLRGQNHSLCSA